MKQINHYILTISGIINIIAGIAISFLPDETATLFDISVQNSDQLLPFKIIGASLFAIGILNYMKRTTPMGGIYGKPMILANMIFHGVIGAQILKAISTESSHLSVFFLPIGFLYSGAGIWFAYLNFAKSPQK